MPALLTLCTPFRLIVRPVQLTTKPFEWTPSTDRKVSYAAEYGHREGGRHPPPLGLHLDIPSAVNHSDTSPPATVTTIDHFMIIYIPEKRVDVCHQVKMVDYCTMYISLYHVPFTSILILI